MINNKLCPRTPRQELDAIINDFKTRGREWENLDIEEQQEICALVALTWKRETINDVLDKVDAVQLVAYMRHVGMSKAKEKAGEYLFTKMQDFLMQFAEQEYLDNPTTIDEGDRIDQAYDRFRDNEMMRDM
jgi:cell division protein YceG involved in septum cleavage